MHKAEWNSFFSSKFCKNETLKDSSFVHLVLSIFSVAERTSFFQRLWKYIFKWSDFVPACPLIMQIISRFMNNNSDISNSIFIAFIPHHRWNGFIIKYSTHFLSGSSWKKSWFYKHLYYIHSYFDVKVTAVQKL